MSDLLALAANLRANIAAEKKIRAEWIETILARASLLLEARNAYSSRDRAFGEWLAEEGITISANDRAALLNMARHPAEARRALEVTERWSVRLIWEVEILPTVYSSLQETAVDSPPLSKPATLPATRSDSESSGAQIVQFPSPEPPAARPVARPMRFETSTTEIALKAIGYVGESKPLIPPPPPPDTDDSSIAWFERRRLAGLRLDARYGNVCCLDALADARSRFSDDEAFAAWLETHGFAIVDDPTVAERAVLAILRAKRTGTPAAEVKVQIKPAL
jgi:hypothetical protein